MWQSITRALGIDSLRQSQDQILSDLAGIRHQLDEVRRSLAHEDPVWREDRFVCVEFRGLRIWVNLKDEHIGRMVLRGAYEDGSVDFVLSHLKEGATLVDVGANVGVYSLQAARAVGPTGRVFAFEPRDVTFSLLERSVRENGFDDRCVLSRKGLSDTSSSGWMHHWAGNDGASFVRQIAATSGGDPIELTTLDDIEFGPRVDFFKVDVEGFETKVLRGGKRFFERYKPPASSEVFPAVLREVGGSSAEEYLSLWKSYGYEIRLYDGENIGRAVEPTELASESNFPEIFNVICLPR